MPIPATAAQMAIALGRSSSGKMFVRIESVVGMIAAAPTPISARDAISCVVPGATGGEQRADPEDDETDGQAPSCARSDRRGVPAIRSSTANTSR